MPSYLPSLLDQKMDRSNTWIVLITGSETKKERIREWCLFPIYFLIFLRQYLFFSFPLAATFFSQSTPNQSSQCACSVLLWRNGCFRGRRDFTKDGLSARQEGKASVQVVQGWGQAMGARSWKALSRQGQERKATRQEVSERPLWYG